MNDAQAMEIVRECMTDETPLTVNLTIKDAWLLVSAIQLATRHPEVSVYMKDSLFSTARQFQTQNEAVHGEAHDLLEMGWDTQFDGVENLDDLNDDDFEGFDEGYE